MINQFLNKLNRNKLFLLIFIVITSAIYYFANFSKITFSLSQLRFFIKNEQAISYLVKISYLYNQKLISKSYINPKTNTNTPYEIFIPVSGLDNINDIKVNGKTIQSDLSKNNDFVSVTSPSVKIYFIADNYLDTVAKIKSLKKI